MTEVGDVDATKRNECDILKLKLAANLRKSAFLSLFIALDWIFWVFVWLMFGPVISLEAKCMDLGMGLMWLKRSAFCYITAYHMQLYRNHDDISYLLDHCLLLIIAIVGLLLNVNVLYHMDYMTIRSTCMCLFGYSFWEMLLVLCVVRYFIMLVFQCKALFYRGNILIQSIASHRKQQ